MIDAWRWVVRGRARNSAAANARIAKEWRRRRLEVTFSAARADRHDAIAKQQTALANAVDLRKRLAGATKGEGLTGHAAAAAAILDQMERGPLREQLARAEEEMASATTTAEAAVRMERDTASEMASDRDAEEEKRRAIEAEMLERFEATGWKDDKGGAALLWDAVAWWACCCCRFTQAWCVRREPRGPTKTKRTNPTRAEEDGKGRDRDRRETAVIFIFRWGRAAVIAAVVVAPLAMGAAAVATHLTAIHTLDTWRAPLRALRAASTEADDPLGCDDIAAMPAGRRLEAGRGWGRDDRASLRRLAHATKWRGLPVVVRALARRSDGEGGDGPGGRTDGWAASAHDTFLERTRARREVAILRAMRGEGVEGVATLLGACGDAYVTEATPFTLDQLLAPDLSVWPEAAAAAAAAEARLEEARARRVTRRTAAILAAEAAARAEDRAIVEDAAAALREETEAGVPDGPAGAAAFFAGKDVGRGDRRREPEVVARRTPPSAESAETSPDGRRGVQIVRGQVGRRERTDRVNAVGDDEDASGAGDNFVDGTIRVRWPAADARDATIPNEDADKVTIPNEEDASDGGGEATTTAAAAAKESRDRPSRRDRRRGKERGGGRPTDRRGAKGKRTGRTLTTTNDADVASDVDSDVSFDAASDVASDGTPADPSIDARPPPHPSSRAPSPLRREAVPAKDACVPLNAGRPPPACGRVMRARATEEDRRRGLTAPGVRFGNDRGVSPLEVGGGGDAWSDDWMDDAPDTAGGPGCVDTVPWLDPSPASRLGVGRDVAAAVAAVHGVALPVGGTVAHGGIDPGSIGMTRRGRPVLLTLGDAVLVAPEKGLPGAGAGGFCRGGGDGDGGGAGQDAGAWRSDEERRRRRLDEKIDVYALGGVLHRLMAGPGWTDPTVPAPHANDTDVDIAAGSSDVASDVASDGTPAWARCGAGPSASRACRLAAALVARCWARDPTDRPTAADVVQELDAVLLVVRRDAEETEPGRSTRSGVDPYRGDHLGDADADVAATSPRCLSEDCTPETTCPTAGGRGASLVADIMACQAEGTQCGDLLEARRRWYRRKEPAASIASEVKAARARHEAGGVGAGARDVHLGRQVGAPGGGGTPGGVTVGGLSVVDLDAVLGGAGGGGSTTYRAGGAAGGAGVEWSGSDAFSSDAHEGGR